MPRFDDKVLWITGASSGIGEATALAASREGATLILSARRQGALEALKERCKNPGKVHVLPLDMALSEELPHKVEEALKLTGRVDIMVHNAGVSQRSLAAETSLDVDRRLMEINFFGVVALTRALLPHMHKGGQIVVVSSVAGLVGTPLRSSYAASKHALHGFFESLRAETAHDELSITMVCPGYIATGISERALQGDGSQRGYRSKNEKTGMPPEVFARHFLKAIHQRKEEAYIGGMELAGIYLRRFAPRLLTRLIHRVDTS